MVVRCWAQFTSTLPDDQIEEEGEIVQYGGRGVAFAVADILRRLGCEIEGPEHAYEHGWDFHARIQGRRFFGQVTDMGEFLLLFKNPVWLDRVLNRQPQIYLDFASGPGAGTCNGSALPGHHLVHSSRT